MLNGLTQNTNVDKYLLNALQEDIPSEDITTHAIIKEIVLGSAQLLCKQDGIIAGLDIFKRVFELLGSIDFTSTYRDGDKVKKGDVIGTLTGDMRILLSGERTALNYLQRMSGIATLTHEYVLLLKDSSTRLLDTRKTTPNMRLFEKYAVKVGGACNHRFNLSDGILIKDNHIQAAGSITEAIKRVREHTSFIRKIEVEVETLPQVQEALDAGADIIMLDNMDIPTIKHALSMINGKAETECSGNVDQSRLKELSQLGLDYISSGILTHSAPILDFSLKNFSYL